MTAFILQREYGSRSSSKESPGACGGVKLDNKWVSVSTFRTSTCILDFCDGLR